MPLLASPPKTIPFREELSTTLAGVHTDPGTAAERFPNPGVPEARESLLPAHPKLRPEMDVPRIHPHQCELPRQQKKSSSKKRMSKEEVVAMLNSKTEELIEDLSSRGKFVPDSIVRQTLMELLRKAGREHTVDIRLFDVTAWGEYSKLHGRVDEFIKLYCMFTPICSLHELGLALAEAEKVGHYDNLHLGPLIRHPRVRDYFKPPEDLDTPPEITLFDLHTHLMKLMSRRKRDEKFNFEDYLEHMCKKLELESANHLCVRIRSFPLLIQVCTYTHT